LVAGGGFVALAAMMNCPSGCAKCAMNEESDSQAEEKRFSPDTARPGKT
jgi:hypothetical protein